MSLFGTLRDDPITSFTRPQIRHRSESLSSPILSTKKGVTLTSGDIQDQFILFQFNDQVEGPRILDTSEVKAKLKGSPEKPDTLVRMQLLSFNIGAGEKIDESTRATLRIDLGKDENSNSPLDTVFWSIAAGLNLYNKGKKRSTDPKDLTADFNAAFSKRPIEVPGSLGKLTFEVIRHKEPPWWKKVFSFLQSGVGEALISPIGFPGITSQAVGMLDEFLSRLDGSEPEILFKSRPMTLALSELAKTDYLGGTPGVTVGVLNPGFCLLARGRDYRNLVSSDPVFMGAFGKLKPSSVSMQNFLEGTYNDPFAGMTYAVLRVASADTKLDPSLRFT